MKTEDDKYLTTEAQRRAQVVWNKKNRTKRNIASYKGSAKTFVRHHATKEEIEELIEIFNNENPNAKKEG